MAVLGIARIESIQWEGSGNFTANISFIGTQASAGGSTSITGIAANITTAPLQSAIATYCKTQLINIFGYTFGLFDYVSVLGATL